MLFLWWGPPNDEWCMVDWALLAQLIRSSSDIVVTLLHVSSSLTCVITFIDEGNDTCLMVMMLLLLGRINWAQ